jgi:hypothetical protein
MGGRSSVVSQASDDLDDAIDFASCVIFTRDSNFYLAVQHQTVN